MEAARRRTGLEDFGDPSFREPMAVLLDSIEREARLSPVGRVITRERLVSVLANRAKVEAAVRADPEIATRPLAAPLVIIGLQRTGTTLLHRLLASNPRRRWLASWEALAPAPVATVPVATVPVATVPVERVRIDEGGGEDPRVKAAIRAERALAYLAPDFFAVHPVRARGPEEDVLLLDLAFRSTVPESTLRVPTYARWLEGVDQRPAYETMALLMRVLSSQRGGDDRWLLKTPHHLEWLDVLFDVFPGTQIIWSHRDPIQTVPSFCSMIAHGRGVFSDEVDPHEVGRDWSRKIARLVDRAMETRKRRGDASFLDVQYDALVEDPISELRRIHEFTGEDFTADLERRAREALAGHPQHAFGRHRYRLEDFGLTKADLRERFASYRERFVIGSKA
jgi:hypothetical protein